MSCCACRSSLRLCHKWSQEETTTDLKAKQGSEVSEHPDYYNVSPRKTPLAGAIEELQLTQEERKQDAEMQRVKVF